MNVLGNSTKVLSTFLFFLATFFSSNIASAYELEENSTDKVYAQLSSSKNQVGVGENIVKIENIDAISGLKVKSHHEIEIEESGLYFIMATGQAGSEAFELLGKVDMWLIINGIVQPHSNVSQTVTSSVSVYSFVLQNVLFLKKGDIVSVGMSASCPQLGLIANKNLAHEVDSPSFILSIFKVASK